MRGVSWICNNTLAGLLAAEAQGFRMAAKGGEPVLAPPKTGAVRFYQAEVTAKSP